jgi:hypothetical protein
MQDKPLNIDEKFVDKAWSDMSILLDREMPVQVDRPRIGLGWWLTLIAVGLVIGGGILFYGKKMGTAPAVPSQPVAIASQPSTDHQSKMFTNPAEQPVSIAETTSTSSNSSSSLQSPKIQKNNLSSGKVAPNSKSKLHSGTLVTTQNGLGSNDRNSKKEPLMTTPITGTKPAVQDGLAEYPKHTEMEELGKLALHPFETSFDNKLNVDARFAAKNKIIWGIQSSWITVPNLAGGGFTIEAVGEKPLSNRFSIEMGVGYAYLKQPIYAGVNAVNVSTSEQDGRIGYDSNFTSDLVSSPSIDTVYRNRYLDLHYLNLPVQVYYHLNNRLSVKAGINTGVLLASRSSYTQSGLLENFGLASEQKSSAGQLFKVSIYDFAATAGISFRFNRAASLHFDYLHGLADVLPQNQVGDNNRLLKLGFRYNLSRGR